MLVAEVVNDNNALQKRELFCIKILNMAYPFGLNDNIALYGNISEGITPLNKVGHPYFSLPFATRNRSKLQKKHRRSKNVNNSVVDDLKVCLLSRTYGRNFELYIYLKQQSQKTLALCHKYIAQCNQDCDPVLKLAIAFLAGYFKQFDKSSFGCVSVDRIFVPFLSPVMDCLRLKSLFMATSVKKLNPLPPKYRRKLQIVFNFNLPFSKKVFNYGKDLRETNSLLR